MKTALVLGGASCLRADIEAYAGPFQGVVACNEAGAEWDGALDAWVSLHPMNFIGKGWIEKRSGPPARRLLAHEESKRAMWQDRYPAGIAFTDYRFPGQNRSGSSGLFAAKVALVDLGFDRAVLCGVPLTETPHFFDREDWRGAEGFRSSWLALPEEYRDRMRSMSGWTRTLLGAPEIETKEKSDEQP